MLIARWQLVGFIHGVMNTDNMALSGETIDYGPCAFMDGAIRHSVQLHRPAGVRVVTSRRCAVEPRPTPKRCCRCSIGTSIAQWACHGGLDRFPGLFEQHWLDGMRAKLGLFTQEEGDKALVDDLLAWMQRRSADFTNTFRSLTSGRLVGDSTNADPELEAWHHRLAARRGRQPQSPAEAEDLMRRHNPAFIPRNHNVEEALQAATNADDDSVMERLLDVLATPYDHGRDLPMFSTSSSGEQPYRTFCGT
jgi:uncharacterized protein YdiU (UPF0061 family)